MVPRRRSVCKAKQENQICQFDDTGNDLALTHQFFVSRSDDIQFLSTRNGNGDQTGLACLCQGVGHGGVHPGCFLAVEDSSLNAHHGLN